MNTMDDVKAHLKRGMPIVVTDERGKQGSALVALSAHITYDTLNMMIKQARGIVSVALTEDYVRKLKLPMMTRRNRRYTVSVDSCRTSTGISVADRLDTIRMLVNPDPEEEEPFRMPGHMFPVVVHPLGLRVCRHEAEAGVALATAVDAFPSAVFCKLLSERDGRLATEDEAARIARRFGMPHMKYADVRMHNLFLKGSLNAASY